MKPYRLYIFDLDGTIYRGRDVVPHAGAVITELLRRESQVRFFTNNSAARPSQISAMLNHMGVPCKSEWVFGTGQLAADHCRTNGFGKVYVVGEEALKQTLADGGVKSVEDDPDAVVVGICRSFTYEILDRASHFIRTGTPFVATNLDATYPLEKGRLQPGSGAIVASVKVASGRDPTVLGKPEPYLANLAIASAGVPAAETLVVGDRLDTDIACGKAAGCDTYLVLTGVESSIEAGQAGGQDLRGLL